MYFIIVYSLGAVGGKNGPFRRVSDSLTYI